MLVRLAEAAGADADDAAEVGREQGRADARRYTERRVLPRGARRPSSTVLGFDPAVDGTDDGETAVIAFAHCPFRELAEAHPELVCTLHRGMVEGFVEADGRRRRSTTSTRSPTGSLARSRISSR